MAAIDGFISTKLIMPPLKTRMVNRTHLVDRLSRGRTSRLIVVSGVAGSGKTSLVSQWAMRDNLKIAWYSLDESDNEPDLFFRYLLTALKTVDGGSESVEEKWLQSEKRLFGRDVVSYLINELAHASRDIYLVLDDYQFITSKEIHTTLFHFLEHVSGRIHVVMTSRYGIPFSLSHFKVRNELTEISASDMRFTDKETEEFFADVIPVPLTLDEAREVARHTEGWVGGLQLFGLSVNGREGPVNFADTLGRVDQEATDYLVDEVIGVQPGKVRTFLQRTALLDRFNADVCREITGMENAGDILDRIYRNNLFLIPLDAGHTWYRYHHLFSQAVRARAKVTSPDRMSRIYKEAARWFVRNGYLEDAFRNAFASEDMEFAADLLEDCVQLIIERFEHASGLRWLLRLPREVFLKRTLLRLHECGKIESFELSDIEAVVKDIEGNQTEAFRRYEGRKKALCMDLFTCFRYVLPYYYRDPAHADIEQLDKAFGMISPESRFLAGYIKILIARSYLLQGNPTPADAALKDGAALFLSCGSPWGRILCFRLAATVARMEGHLHRSEAILREAFAFLEENSLADAPLRFLLYLPMAWVLYHRNDLEKAAEFAGGAEMYGEHVKLARDVIEGNLLLSLIHLSRGEAEVAGRYAREMQRISKELDAPVTSVSPVSWILRLSLRQSDLRVCEEWSAQRSLREEEPFSLRFFDESMARAELFYRKGHYREAAGILERLRGQCTERSMREAVLDIDLLRCATLCGLGDYSSAGAILKKALAYAEEEGYVRPVLDYAPMIRPLLQDTAAVRPGSPRSSFMEQVFSAGAGAGGALPGRKRAGRRSMGELTAREIEVLGLMAEGYQYKEIAGRTSVSLTTVKTHAKHILGKLVTV